MSVSSVLKIGFQGDIGSNAEEAANCFKKTLDKATDCLALISSKRVVEALLDGEIDFGVIALHNSIIGEVVETKEALNCQVELLTTISIPIHHCLFKKAKDSDISFVASHIQALQQTEKSTNKILGQVRRIECRDTALAAKMLAFGKYPDDYAVICRKNAGEMYGLYMAAQNIEDEADNYTVFGIFILKK